jgi:hypothetical protein
LNSTERTEVERKDFTGRRLEQKVRRGVHLIFEGESLLIFKDKRILTTKEEAKDFFNERLTPQDKDPLFCFS